MKGILAAGTAMGLAAAVVGTAIPASAASLLGGSSGAPAASSAATAKIPPAMLTLYQDAATTCTGLPWTVLAAIGTESDNGQSTLPGVHSGANVAGAEGPMQFEPANFSIGSTNRRPLTCDFPLRVWRRVLTSCSSVVSRGVAHRLHHGDSGT
jgi:hypothetical protein